MSWRCDEAQRWAAVCALLVMAATPVTAGGTSPIGPSGALLSSAPIGADDFLSGPMPPPGVYWLNYTFHYRADSFRDGNGNRLTSGPLDGFEASVTGNVYRFFWMPERDIRIRGALGNGYGHRPSAQAHQTRRAVVFRHRHR